MATRGRCGPQHFTDIIDGSTGATWASWTLTSTWWRGSTRLSHTRAFWETCKAPGWTTMEALHSRKGNRYEKDRFIWWQIKTESHGVWGRAATLKLHVERERWLAWPPSLLTDKKKKGKQKHLPHKSTCIDETTQLWKKTKPSEWHNLLFFF